MSRTDKPRSPYALGPLPLSRSMITVDQCVVHAPLQAAFAFVRDAEAWPSHLSHYRFVRFRHRARDGGGLVEMSANRPFGPINWPTWWLSEMAVDHDAPNVRFRHVGGITTGMDVEWNFKPVTDGTLVRLIHVWNGPSWPMIGVLAANVVIGPVFVHGIASRTMAGLARAAEADAGRTPQASGAVPS